MAFYKKTKMKVNGKWYPKAVLVSSPDNHTRNVLILALTVAPLFCKGARALVVLLAMA